MHILAPIIIAALIGLAVRALMGERAGAIVICGLIILAAACGGVALIAWSAIYLCSSGPDLLQNTSQLVLHPAVTGPWWRIAIVSLLGAPATGIGLYGLIFLWGEMSWMSWASALWQNDGKGEPRSRTKFESKVLWSLELLVVLVVPPVLFAEVLSSSLVTIIGSLCAWMLHSYVLHIINRKPQSEEAVPTYPTSIVNWIAACIFMLAEWCLLVIGVVAAVLAGMSY
jgi:hypothetical protein